MGEVTFRVVSIDPLGDEYAATVDLIVGDESLRIWGVKVVDRGNRYSVFVPYIGKRRGISLSDGLYFQLKTVVTAHMQAVQK